MTDKNFLIDGNVSMSMGGNSISAAPTREETLRFALTDRPITESDEESAVKAEYLGNVYFDLLQKAQRGVAPTMNENDARAEAVYFSRALTGQNDVYGKLWKKGGFATGREYLEKMHDFFLNGGEKNLSQKLRDFNAKSYDEQVQEALGDESILSAVAHGLGEAFSYGIDWLHHADTDKVAAEHALKEDIYKRAVRNRYAAKLMAENAWYELSAILPTLSDDARVCAKALIESKDNRLPEEMWAKFNELEDDEKSLICRARTCLAPNVEGSFANTIGDMAVGAANIAASVIAAPYRFGNKLGMIYANKYYDAGFDVNEISRRRQYLWQATGRFLAGGGEGYSLPQLQFEQICNDHGFVAEALIGAVSTLPYMAAAAIPGIGVATVAMEAMNEMDDYVAMNGGDIADPDYIFSNALFGALYAYTERLQVEGLLGGVNDLRIREAMLKGFFTGIKDKASVRALTIGSLSESIQEGLQNGIMSANEALALKGDAAEAFADGFVQDFVGSLGTMFIVEAGVLVGGHLKRSGFNNPFTAKGAQAGQEARSADLESIYEADMSKRRMTSFARETEDVRLEMKSAEEARIHNIWKTGGVDALVRAGIDRVRAEEWDYYYNSIRDEVKDSVEPQSDRKDKIEKDIEDYVVGVLTERSEDGAEEEVSKLELSLNNLAHVRSEWAKGAGIYQTDEDGNVIDMGMKALEDMGFTPKHAERISKLFHLERAAAYSPAALEGIREAYSKRMQSRVGAIAAMAKNFGGKLTYMDGKTYLRFDRAEGSQLVEIIEGEDPIDFTEYSEGVAVDIEKATNGDISKNDWREMTPEARRTAWEKSSLYSEGSFTPNAKPVSITLPADPSARVSSNQAAKIIGTIRVSTTSVTSGTILDSSAAFHETYHAFAYFAESSGLWTKEEVAELAKAYGAAKTAGELHDEEAAAEAFRSYCVRRASGALTSEDEKSPFAKIFAVASGLETTAKENAAKEKAATKQEKAMTEQVMVEKPVAEDVFAKHEEEKPEESTRPVLRTWRANVPNTGIIVGGRYEIVKLSELIHSANPLYAAQAELQKRFRANNKVSEEKLETIKNTFFAKYYLQDAASTADGAPIVAPLPDAEGNTRLFVISGNGRVMVLNALKDAHYYDRYRNDLNNYAKENGYKLEELADGDEYALVRVIDDLGGSTLEEIATYSNTENTTARTETEQARVDADTVRDLNLAGMYVANADGTPNMARGVNDDFFRLFSQNAPDGARIYGAKRTITEDGRNRVLRSLLYLSCGQGERGPAVVEKIIEQTPHLGIQRQRNAMECCAAAVAALDRNSQYAIGADVSRAMADYIDYVEKKAAGKIGNFSDFLGEVDMFDPRSMIAENILNILASDKSAAGMAEYIKAYCRAAALSDTDGSLGGGVTARSREQVWREASKTVDESAAEKRWSITKMNEAARRKDLLAIHNMSMSGIKDVAELGGFAMPSIAVVKDSDGHKDYGDVSVLFDRDTIDTTNRSNALYSHDAWTPTFPPIYNKIDEKGIEEVNDKLRKSLPEDVRSAISGDFWKFLYRDGIHDAFDQAKDAADAYAYQIVMKAAYLVSKGEKIDVVYRDVKYNSKWDNNELRAIYDKFGDKLYEIREEAIRSGKRDDAYREIFPELKSFLMELVDSKPEVSEKNIERKKQGRKTLGEMLYGDVNYGDDKLDFWEISAIAESVHDYISGGDRKEIDTYATKRAIDSRVEATDETYRSWINSQYSNPILGKGVYNGKERFTPSGNSRSWNALHDPATLENIVKAMKKNNRANGVDGIFGRNPYGVAVRKFASLKQLIDNEGLLKTLSEDEIKAIKEEFNQRLLALGATYMESVKNRDNNQFIAFDRAMDMIYDAWEGSRGSFSMFAKLLNGYGYSADDKLARDIMDVLEEISMMPTKYFEAKPQRAVGFDETRAWIVPDTISAEDRKILEDRGQRILTYKTGDEEDRLRVVNEAADRVGARFSIKRLFTGTSADYEKPSLLKVGTGEGSQVYGWGLYASNQRGVAETYVPSDDQVQRAKQYRDYLRKRISSTTDPYLRETLEFDLKIAEKAAPKQIVYEQTFFTNRAPGDESHLLNWYERVSDVNLDRIFSRLKEEGVADRFKEMYWLRYKGMSSYLENGDIEGAILDNGSSGDAVYEQLVSILGSPKDASEFLARADIDGVKYPVDSYGKTVKNGDEAGWNYVSFRDDNISIDHKWVDGEQRYSIKAAEIERNIDDILSRFDEAKGKTKAEILKEFSSENKLIAALPMDIDLPEGLRAESGNVFGSQSFILDHLVNSPHHEQEYTSEDAKRVLGLIDPRNEMRVVPQRGSLSLAFIAPNPVSGWDCVVIAPHGGKFYLFKTMFGQERKPYQSKTLIRYTSSVRQGKAADLLMRGGLSSVRDFSDAGIIANPAQMSQTDENRFSVAMAETLDPVAWGDLSRSIKIVGNGEPPFVFKKGAKVKDIKKPLFDAAVANFKKQPNYKEVDGSHCLEIDGNLIAVTQSGINHGLDRRYKLNGYASSLLGDLLNNSVEVPNVESPMHYRLAKMDIGRSCFVLITTHDNNGIGKIQNVEVLYSVNAKAENAEPGQTPRSTLRSDVDIVSNLRDAWQRVFLPGLVNHNAKRILADNQASPEEQYEAVEALYRGTDKWMKAPNGKPTNLTERQWVQVRTPAFKAWFGDWENDPANASKVVDENGEPLVVYRGEDSEQTEFFFGYRDDNGWLQRNWFTSSKEVAKMFGNTNGRGYFLNIRNVAEYDAKGNRYDNLSYGGETVSNSVVDQLYGDNPSADGVVLRNIVETDKGNIVADDWLVKDTLPDAPTRIKSATDNVGAFSPTNPDIRFSIRSAKKLVDGILVNDQRANELLSGLNYTKFAAFEAGQPSMEEIAQSPEEKKAREAIKSYAKSSAEAAQDALENYIAYFKLSHGAIPRAMTINRIGLSLGMPVVNAKRIIKNADQLAQRAKGSLIETAAKNGDVGTAMSLLKREKDIDATVDDIIAGGVKLGGKLTHKGVGQVNALLQRRIDRMMSDMNAATLADMEGDTGLDLAAEILSNNPDAFEVEYRQAKKTAEAASADEEAEESKNGDEASREERPLSDADRYKRAQLLKEANEKVAGFIEEAKRRALENKEKAQERQRRVVELGGEQQSGEGDSGVDNETPKSDTFNPTPTASRANFKTPGEFAAFLRVYAQHKFAKTHGLTTLGQVEQDRLFAEFYRLCARQELQDLADKLLAPVDETGKPVARLAKLGAGSRVYVNRRLADMEKGLKPDAIERMTADIFAFINKAAIRVSRVDLITSFKRDIKERYLEGPEFKELKQDSERKVTGWVEEAARYICHVCDLSTKAVNGKLSELEEEYQKLNDIINKRQKVYDESGKEVADAPQEDAKTIEAQWKLALLDSYGAMRSLMPGEILNLQNDAFKYLEEEAAALSERWRETRAAQEEMRQSYSAAIVGPNGQRYTENGVFGFAEKLFDGLNGMIHLRLRHLTRFASEDRRAKAEEAINDMLVMLGDGETAFARALQDDRAALMKGLASIFNKNGKADNAAIKRYIERMDDAIPKELAKQLSNQGYADSMTYGQMLQLLVSLEQRSFKDTIKANGREGQAELIRSFKTVDKDGHRVNVFTREDDAFVDFLRAFYAAKRDELSAVTLRMVGHKVDSPDPLYCPIRRWVDDKARGLHSDPISRWDPISKIFSRRVESTRDFDESRTILGLFYENSRESAKLTAWAERGSFIRNVVTSVSFQTAVKRAFGNAELGKILKQLEATFNGGETLKSSPAELAVVDKALNFSTYAYLGFNPLSALKQTTSFTVWANALPGGFKDLWRHMTHVDKGVVKHLMESDEYKVRYGNEIGSGQDMATKGLNSNPVENPIVRGLNGAGLWLLKKGDFAPGIWIAQGVYKDLLNKHLTGGIEFADADKRAITETFNMLEETQQSGRTYNTNMLTIEHGRIGRLLTQFATSPIQQLQWETQALREWRDMVRYGQGEKKIAAARQKFVRAAIINHVLLPAALNMVVAMYKAALGEEPPWEKDGYHWSLLIQLLLGQFSRVFFLGAFAETTLTALLKRETPRASKLLPVEGVLTMGVSAAITVRDLVTCNVDNLQKDIERAMKSTAPTRIPYQVYRRVTGDADVDRKKAKEAQKRK